MKKLLVTAKPFNGTIPFRILQRGRVLVEDTFSGKCSDCSPPALGEGSRRFFAEGYSRTYEVSATDEDITVECNAGIVSATLLHG
ncbi:hypothetical protein AADC78_005359 [Escherichia coli]